MEEQDVIGRARHINLRNAGPFSLVVALLSAALVIFLSACLLIWQDTNLYLENRILQEVVQAPHKPLFPFSTRDALGFFLASLGLMMAAGGGIGGGGILVPIYILVLQFPAKEAIPLSNVTVFGGAIANTLLNICKRHPLVDRPLIDWTIIMVMEPLTILGSLFGANLNKLLPETVIVVLLVVLLSLTAWKTLAKAMKLHEKETMGWTIVDSSETGDKENELELVETGRVVPTVKPLTRGVSDSVQFKERFMRQGSLLRRSSSLPLSILQGAVSDSLTRSSTHGADASPKKLKTDSCNSFDLDVQACTNAIETIQYEPRNPALERILEEERRSPASYVCCIGSLFFFVLLINILKGGGAFPSPIGIECGSLSFWLAEAVILIVICAVSWSARSSLLQRTRLKQDSGYQYLECDIEWNETSTSVYPLFSCTAGFVAGLFGIGGGIIKGPLMLAMGVHPAVASATSACMILFTSFTATTSFAVFGLLVKDYGLLCLANGFVATLLGQTIMSLILERHQRSSYIAFCIGGVVLLSAICMTVESVIRISTGDGSGRSDSLCSAHLE